MAKVRVMRRNETGEMEELAVEPKILTGELAELIGRQSSPVTLEVERGAIRKYAQATEDPNPLYHDMEYARKSKYGEIICPPGFFGSRIKPRDQEEESLPNRIREATGRSTGMNIGGELEFMLPIRAGDVLTAVTRLADLYEEIGRSGNRLLVHISETTYNNQNGDIVARSQSRSIHI